MDAGDADEGSAVSGADAAESHRAQRHDLQRSHLACELSCDLQCSCASVDEAHSFGEAVELFELRLILWTRLLSYLRLILYGGSHECHHLAARSVAVTLSRQTAARIWIMVSWVLVTTLLLVTIS